MPAILSSWSYWASLVGIASLLGLILSAVLLPWAIGRLPADYFVGQKERQLFGGPLANAGLVVARNLCGVLLVAAGFILLFVPGQGLLTIVLGLALIDFPGKHRLIVLLAARPRITQGLQWLRAKSGAPPFEWSPHSPTSPPQEAPIRPNPEDRR